MVRGRQGCFALPRKDYPEYYVVLDRVFGPLGLKPRVAVERDTSSSIFTAIESGAESRFQQSPAEEGLAREP